MDSKRLRTLKALTAHLEAEVTPANGYQHDLTKAVFRGRALFGVPAGGHRLRALRVEAAGVPVGHDAQLDVQPGRAEAGQGGGGPEVEVVRVGADGQDPAPAVVGGELSGGGECGGQDWVSSVNVTSVFCSAPSRR